MNFCYDLWEIEPEDSPFRVLDSRFDSHCFADLEFSSPPIQKDHENNANQSVHQQEPQRLGKTTAGQNKCGSFFQESLQRSLQLVERQESKKPARNRKKRIIKPSPYHNYQKHLNSTLKQLIKLPELDLSSSAYCSIAHDLWSVFKQSTLSTKKILHFVFNQFNQYKITQRELRQLGFSDIYERSTLEELGQAKNYLTELALSQLNQENIDGYLTSRRIKNQIKFKKYLLLFRQELEDGFLKKRFTNRSRKQQIRKQICKACSS